MHKKKIHHSRSISSPDIRFLVHNVDVFVSESNSLAATGMVY